MSNQTKKSLDQLFIDEGMWIPPETRTKIKAAFKKWLEEIRDSCAHVRCPDCEATVKVTTELIEAVDK